MIGKLDQVTRYNIDMEFFIPGNVISKKNNKTGVKGKYINFQWPKYLQNFKRHLKPIKKHILKQLADKEKPYKVGFYFIRPTKHKFDYSNKIETVADALTESEILNDDNMTELWPVILGYEVNKQKAGVIIKIL